MCWEYELYWLTQHKVQCAEFYRVTVHHQIPKSAVCFHADVLAIRLRKRLPDCCRLNSEFPGRVESLRIITLFFLFFFTLSIYYRFHILYSSHYNAYVINVYGRFVLYFHLHYRWFLKSPASFRSHTKYESSCYWSMHTVEQIWWFFWG